MEWTSTPGVTDNNTCFFAICLTDRKKNFPASKHFLQDVRNWKNIFSDPPF